MKFGTSNNSFIWTLKVCTLAQKDLGSVTVFKIVQCCQNDTFPGNYKTIINTKLRNWTKITDNQVLKLFLVTTFLAPFKGQLKGL